MTTRIWFFLMIGFLIPSLTIAADSKNQTLDARQRNMIPIAAFTAMGDQRRLASAMHEGLDSGLTINEIKEILIQSYAYAGFPRALNGITTFMDVVEHRKARGQIDSVGKEASPVPVVFDRLAYGNKTRNALVGLDMTNRTTGYAGFVPTIDQFLVSHLFADIFYRDVLTPKERELVTVSFLAAMPGVDPQLKSHLDICARVGWSKEQLQDFARTMERYTSRANILLPGQLLEEKYVTVTQARPAIAGDTTHFTGKVKVESLFASGTPFDYKGGIVHFEKGAKTAWHTHPFGQTLIILSGSGLVQQDGATAQTMQPGDVVWIPANVKHWHGASPTSPMSHVAISSPLHGETVEWMERVK